MGVFTPDEKENIFLKKRQRELSINLQNLSQDSSPAAPVIEKPNESTERMGGIVSLNKEIAGQQWGTDAINRYGCEGIDNGITALSKWKITATK